MPENPTFEEAVESLGLFGPEEKTPVTPEQLLEILKRDVVYALVRPGSWEGSAMYDLLSKHGLVPR